MNYKPNPCVDTNYDLLFADGHYEEAISFMRQFLLENAQNPYAEMIAYINIASCYYYLEQIEQAYEHVLIYKQLCQQYGNQQDYYNLYHIKALIYNYEQNYVKAAVAASHCIDIASQLNLQQELAESFNLYSYIQIVLGNYDEALQCALSAQEIAYSHSNDNLFLICQIHCNLASTYTHLNRYPEAQNMLMLLSDNPYIHSNLKERSRYLYLQGIIHLKSQNYSTAISLFEEARQAGESLRDLPMLQHLLWDLAAAYEEIQNFEYAYKNMKAYGLLCNEILGMRNSSNVADLYLHHSVAIVEQRANIDQLSGVYTRSYLEATCDEWLQQARIANDHICCIVFDVDNFKNINDNYGHLVGDEVIKQLGQTCQHLVNTDQALVGRYGGDEFVILLKNYSMRQVEEKSREIFDALSNIVIMHEHHVIQLTVSMGIICNSSIIANKFTQLFKVADQALYMAKKHGKNQIVTLSNNNCEL